MHSNNVNNFFKDYGLSIVTYRNLNKAVGWNRFMKRTFDLFFCMLALPFAIIVIIAFSLLIRLDSKGPVFYTQIRVGLDGRYFRVFKLRSMYIDAEKDGEKFAVKNDPRVTRIGRIMRKARIYHKSYTNPSDNLLERFIAFFDTFSKNKNYLKPIWEG